MQKKFLPKKLGALSFDHLAQNGMTLSRRDLQRMIKARTEREAFNRLSKRFNPTPRLVKQ
jgi:hypothetical protein